jgi:hypothetical protein
VPARLVLAAHLAPCCDSRPGEYKKYTPGLRVLQNATCAAQSLRRIELQADFLNTKKPLIAERLFLLVIR